MRAHAQGLATLGDSRYKAARRLPHEDDPDMAKRISGWMPLAAALIASLGVGGADGMAAYAVGGYQGAYDLWQPLADQADVSTKFDLGLLYAEGHGAARDDVAAIKWYRLAAT